MYICSALWKHCVWGNLKAAFWDSVDTNAHKLNSTHSGTLVDLFSSLPSILFSAIQILTPTSLSAFPHFFIYPFPISPLMHPKTLNALLKQSPDLDVLIRRGKPGHFYPLGEMGWVCDTNEKTLAAPQSTFYCFSRFTTFFLTATTWRNMIVPGSGPTIPHLPDDYWGLLRRGGHLVKSDGGAKQVRLSNLWSDVYRTQSLKFQKNTTLKHVWTVFTKALNLSPQCPSTCPNSTANVPK